MAAIRFRAEAPAGPGRFVWKVCLATTAGLMTLMLLAWKKTWEASTVPEAVTLPVALMAQADTRRYDVLVNIMRSGAYRLKGMTYSRRDLENFLVRSALRRAGPDGSSSLTVKIRCDAGAPYQYVLAAIRFCQRAGIRRVSFGVNKGYGGAIVPEVEPRPAGGPQSPWGCWEEG